jgi:CheY-like chemotaxis protein
MGGELAVRSQPGRGSTFALALPVAVGDPTVAAGAAPARVVVGLEPGQPAFRLLVVDDSEVNRRLLVRLFRPLGFEVYEASDGREALEAWETHAPQLIWMDMRMPVMDGYEATRRIKSTTRGQATTVIALTASALEEDRAVILSEGCDEYVRKPFREHELFEILTRFLGVRFVYAPAGAAEAAPEVDRAALAQALAAQPAPWRAELRQAVRLGYGDRISALLAKQRARAPEAIGHLERLAQAYEHEAILAALRQAEAGP